MFNNKWVLAAQFGLGVTISALATQASLSVMATLAISWLLSTAIHIAYVKADL